MRPFGEKTCEAFGNATMFVGKQDAQLANVLGGASRRGFHAMAEVGRRQDISVTPRCGLDERVRAFPDSGRTCSGFMIGPVPSGR